VGGNFVVAEGLYLGTECPMGAEFFLDLRPIRAFLEG